MTEFECKHEESIEEHDEYYSCTRCKKKVPKAIIKGSQGKWFDNEEPPLVAEQRHFEELLYLQQISKTERKS